MTKDLQYFTEVFSTKTEMESKHYIINHYGTKALRKIRTVESQEVRNAEVECLTEAYFHVFNKYPETICLEQLSNYCLLDFIKNNSRSKHNEENSFQTERQEGNLSRKSIPMQSAKLDYFHLVSLFDPPALHKRVTQEVDIEKRFQ